jgi:hypothetical protein
MRRLPLLLVTLAALWLGPAAAQTPPAPPPVRVGGTVDTLAGDALTVKAVDGQMTTVTLKADAAVYGVEKRSIADIKAGDFLASGGVKGSDGKIHAVEVRIFPEALRGLGEGQRPWAVKTDGVMTNATVGTVSQLPDGGLVHVTYKGGDSEYIIGPDVPVVAYVDAGRDLLKPGATVLIFAQRQTDGSLTASRVTAEKDGVKPPL